MALYQVLLVAGATPKGWIACEVGVSCADQQLEVFSGIQIPWLLLTAFVLISTFFVIDLRKTSK